MAKIIKHHVISAIITVLYITFLSLAAYPQTSYSKDLVGITLIQSTWNKSVNLNNECTIDGGILGKIFGNKCGIPNLDSLTNNRKGLVAVLTNFVLSISAAIATIFIIISGQKLIMSNGNSKAIEAAKQSLTAAIFGLILVIIAKSIVTIFVNFFV